MLDISAVENHISGLWPFHTTGTDFKYNFDGFITFSKWPNDILPHTYVQLNRQSVIESVDSGGIFREENDGRKQIPSEYIEKEIIKNISNYLNTLLTLGVNPPLVLMISLLGIKDFQLAIHPGYFRPDYNLIEQQNLMLPEIIIESYSKDTIELSRILKPAFDTLWNAARFPSSLN